MPHAYRVNNLYPNRIQTRGRSVEAVQGDRRRKQMNVARVSKCSPTLMTVLLTDRVSTSESWRISQW
jgi:hypothetical protein